MNPKNNKNDYDGITDEISDILKLLLGNTHVDSLYNMGDSTTIVKDKFFESLIRLQRLENRASGLADAVRLYADINE